MFCDGTSTLGLVLLSLINVLDFGYLGMIGVCMLCVRVLFHFSQVFLSYIWRTY